MSKLNITERGNDFITILDLDGKIRLGEGSSDLHNALRNLVERGKKNIILNMENVSHIDSSGLGELVGGYTTIYKTGGILKLMHLSDKIHELMTMTKLLTVFDVCDTELQAIQSFENQSTNTTYAGSIM